MCFLVDWRFLASISRAGESSMTCRVEGAAGAAAINGSESVNSSERAGSCVDLVYRHDRAAAPERGPVTSDIDVDVCVIGAGLAGLTTARELARARLVGGGDRGPRNCLERIRPQHRLRAARLRLRHGSGRQAGRARRRQGAVVARPKPGFEYVRTTIRETGMPGVDPVEDGWLKVAKSDDADEISPPSA